VAETATHHDALPAVSSGDEAQDLQQLRDLVERSDVEGARTFVKELEELWPDSEPVRHWARVLAPPVARVVTGMPPRSFEPEYAWLKEHGRGYPGCWLAVLGDQLIAADPDPRVVIRSIRETPGAKGALLHYQPLPRP
jgi:hypothetical protein